MTYGSGPVFPLRRIGGDFLTVSGPTLIRQALKQILGTTNDGPNTVGEIPWDTKLGSQLTLLKFKSNVELIIELGEHFVIESIRKYEPRVVVTRANIIKDEQLRQLELDIFYVFNVGTAESPIWSEQQRETLFKPL
jgi:phage baseplate assembly protein W